MRSAHSYIGAVAAFSNAQSKAEGGVCAFSTLTIVFIMVYVRICNVFIYSFFKQNEYATATTQIPEYVIWVFVLIIDELIGKCELQRSARALLQMQWKRECLKLMLVRLLRLVDLTIRKKI